MFLSQTKTNQSKYEKPKALRHLWLFVFGFVFLGFFLGQSSIEAAAGINKEINFQGKVVNTDGTNVANGSYTFVFKLYTASSGGSPTWTDTETLTVTDGIFQYNLGSDTSNAPLPGSVDFNSDNIYLGVEFNSDGEMTPRVHFTAAPYAFNAEKVNGLTVTQTNGTLTIANGETVSFGGSFSTSGSNDVAFTTSGATALTLPTTGTLATLAGTETFTNKTIGSTGLTFSGASTDITTTSGEDLTLTAGGSGIISLNDAVTISGTTTISGLSTTGIVTNTSGGVLGTTTGTNGQLLLGVTGSSPAFATMSSDATITNAGVLTIAANAVALTTDTTGNYVASVANGNGISGGAAGSEGAALTLALGALTANWNQTGAFDISLNNASSELQILESAGATFFGILDAGDLSANRTLTIPDASGTILVSGSTLFTLAGTSGSSQAIASGDTVTIAAGAGITTTGGATDTVTIASTLGTSVDLTSEVTGVLPIANGGTNKALTLAAGAVVWTDADSFEVTAAGTAGQALISGGTTTPTWFAPTAGSVLFAGTSGILQQDNASFFWDDSNNRLGIGTTSPLSQLDVVTGATIAERGLTISQHNTGAHAALINFYKSRGTEASPTTVANSDFIGVFFAKPYDGDQYLHTGAFGFKINGTVTDNSVPTDFIVSTGSTDDASLTNERFRITSAGNVGIGDTTPASLFTVGSGDLFEINTSGAITDVRGITNTGAIASTGGTIDLNVSSNNAVNIGTGTTTSTVSIGGGSNAFSLNSTNIDISTGGAITGATGITSSGTITFSGLTAGGVVQAAAGTGILSVGTLGASSITADSLDFTEFQDQLDLDASTDINAPAGQSYVFSITNEGSGTSFVVNDDTADTTPFIIDATGKVSVGLTGESMELGDGTNTTTYLSFAANRAEVGLNAAGTAAYLKGDTGKDIVLLSNGAAVSSAPFIVKSTGSVGIGDVTPDALLDFDLTSTSTTAATEYGSYFTVSDTGVVTTGTDTTYGNRIDLTRTGATGGTINNYGSHTTLTGTFASGSGTINNYGSLISVTGSGSGTSTNYGLHVTVASADTNYSGIFMGGNFGIGDATPAALFTVGSSDAFQINSSGAITSSDLANNGAILFADASGNIIQDESNFVFSSSDFLSIGTSVPSQILHLNDSNAQVLAEESSTEFLRVGVGETGNTSVIGWDDADALHLGVYDSHTDVTISSLMTILSTGSVGIGDATPASLFTVGSGDLFEIDTNGAITDVRGITNTGTISSTGAIAANGGITFDAATDTVGAFTSAGTIDMSTNILTNIGNTGTDFVASTGALTLAGVLTANGGISLAGSQSLTGAALSYIDLGAIVHNTTANQGLRLPNAASASPSSPTSGEGYIAWDAGGNQLIVYNGSSWTTLSGGGMSIGGSITSATEGSILFAGASGVLAQDNANFFWDDTNNRLGLGDATPDATLDFDFASTSSSAGTEYGSYFTISDTGVVTTGTDTTYGNRTSVTRTGATGGTINTYGQYIDVTGDNAGAGSSITYGSLIDVHGTAGTSADLAYGQYIGMTVESGSTGYGLYVDAGTGAGTSYAAIFTNGRVGVGDTTPNAQFDVDFNSTSTTGATEYGSFFNINDTGVVTTGTDTTYGHRTAVTRTGATGGTINTYGQYIDVTGDSAGAGTSTNYGLYVTVTSADTNYSGIFMGGNVGIGDTTPDALFSVGSTSQFQVNSSGAIAAATGITSSGTITFSGLTAGGVVQAAAGTGILSVGTLGASSITADTLDFTEFQDTLDLDAALTLNQTTNTWSQTFTGTTTTGLTYTASSLTTGSALAVSTTNTATTNTALQAVSFSSTNAQATLANTNGVVGTAFNFTNNPTISGNSEYAVRIQNQLTANTTDTTVAALLFLDNADTTASGTTIVTDAILITNSGGSNFTNFLNTPTLDISAAGAITGATGITSSGTITFSGLSTTGIVTNTSGGVLGTTTGTNGQLLLGVTGSAPAFATMSSDATITNTGVLTIAANAVALTTDTTGNYVASITNGSGIAGGDGGSEGAALTLALGALTANWNQTGAFDISLNNAGSELQILESAGATYFGILDAGDLSADRTLTIPDASGTILVSGSTLFTLAGTSGSSQAIASGDTVTIAAGTGITTTGGATDTVTIASTLGTSVAAGEVDADSLDFTEFQDQLDLDASTDILADGSEVFSITNTGTGNSFLVNDASGDTTPFVITAGGGVVIGATSAASTGNLDILDESGTNAQAAIATYSSSDFPAELELRKAGNTIASPATVTNGHSLGTLRFKGYNSSLADFSNAAGILSYADGAWASAGDTSDSPGALAFFTTPDGSSTGTNRLVISATGHTTFGTSNSALAKVHITSDDAEDELLIGDDIAAGDDASSRITLGNTDGSSFIRAGQGASNYLSFGWVYNATASSAYISLSSAGGSNALVLQRDGGNVGIGGDTTPDALFSVGSTSQFQVNSSGIIASSNNITPNSILTTGQTDEYCLTYEATGTTFEWQTCGGGSGANTALSNLASVAINTSLLPGTNDSIDLGSDSFRWRDLFLGGETIHLGTSTTDEAVISYTTSTNLLNFSTDATSNGDIAFFSDDLYLDKSTGFVGIGTTAPSRLLTLSSSFETALGLDVYHASADPTIIGRRARGTDSSPTAAQADDTLLTIGAVGYGATGFASATKAAIKFHAAENWTDSAQGTYFSFNTTAIGSTTRNERMRIDDAGNVGIGTTDPQAALDVGTGLITGGTNSSSQRNKIDLSADALNPMLNFALGATNTGYLNVRRDSDVIGTRTIFFQAVPDSTSGYGYMEAWNSAGMVVGTGATVNANAGPVIFRPGRAEAMRILVSGNVGIGDTSPASLFTVGASDAFQVDNSGNVDMSGRITAGSGNEVITLATGKIDADALTLTAAADGGTGTSSGSGLIARSDGIGLLQGCSDGQVLKWVESSDTWDCSADSTGGTSKFVVKGSNENVASGTTLQDDNDLTFPVTSGETWTFDFVLRVNNNNSATPDWKSAVKGASGWTCNVLQSGSETAGAIFPQASTSDCDASPSAMANTDIAASSTSYNVRIQGTISPSSSGNVVLQWAPNTSGSLTVLAGSYVIAQKVGGSDLAEIYYTKDDDLKEGDVVSLDHTLRAGVRKANKPYDQEAIGIIATKPGLLLGDEGSNYEGRAVKVALAGRVPVTVNTENGPIRAGDLLTSSSTPGVAMRATKAGQIIGQAMENFEGEGTGSVLAFIKTSNSNGARIANMLSDAPSSENGADLGREVLQHLMSESHGSAASEVIADRIAASMEIITPRVTADTVALNKIEAATGLDINVNLSEGGRLTIGALGEAGITFDEQGNATFKGTVIAEKIAAEKILGLEIFTNKVSAIDDDVSNLDEKIRNFIAAQEDQNEESLGILETENGITVARDASFEEETLFKKLATFAGNVIFRGEISFESVPTFSKDTAGYAVITEGTDKVRIEFEEEYMYAPIVNVSLLLETMDDDEVRDAAEELLLVSEVKYIVTNVTTKGFEIRINEGILSDVHFSWQALAVKDPKTTVSKSSSEDSEEESEPVVIEEDESMVEEEGGEAGVVAEDTETTPEVSAFENTEDPLESTGL